MLKWHVFSTLGVSGTLCIIPHALPSPHHKQWLTWLQHLWGPANRAEAWEAEDAVHPRGTQEQAWRAACMRICRQQLLSCLAQHIPEAPERAVLPQVQACRLERLGGGAARGGRAEGGLSEHSTYWVSHSRGMPGVGRAGQGGAAQGIQAQCA